MTTLLVLAFPYSTSADAAAQDILLQEPDLASAPDAIAVVSCDDDGALHLTTSHVLGEEGHGSFWHLLLTALIFLPGSGALGERKLTVLSHRLTALGLDTAFQDRLREVLGPDSSALLLMARQPVPLDALTALGRFGARMLAASLVPDVEVRLADALDETGELAAGVLVHKPSREREHEPVGPSPALPTTRLPGRSLSSGPDEILPGPRSDRS